MKWETTSFFQINENTMLKKRSELLEFKIYDLVDGDDDDDKNNYTSTKKSTESYYDSSSVENKELETKLEKGRIEKIIKSKTNDEKVHVLAIRNVDYKNNEKRGLYDDAFIIVDNTQTKPIHYIFPGNTDPSKYGESNLVKSKGYPVIQTGTYVYKTGVHNSPRSGSYSAFIQDSDVTIKRDTIQGNDSKTESGKFGINLHKGGRNKNETTSDVSSSGCMTVPSEHWEKFKSTLENTLKKSGKSNFKLSVINSTEI